jgi:hypothetical protein
LIVVLIFISPLFFFVAVLANHCWPSFITAEKVTESYRGPDKPGQSSQTSCAQRQIAKKTPVGWLPQGQDAEGRGLASHAPNIARFDSGLDFHFLPFFFLLLFSLSQSLLASLPTNRKMFKTLQRRSLAIHDRGGCRPDKLNRVWSPAFRRVG